MANEIAACKPIDTTDSVSPAEFLRAFDPDGWHNLVSIPPEGGSARGKTFAPGSWAAIDEWARGENEKGRGVYFTVNEVAPGTADKKPGKADIASIRAIYLDTDPRKDAPYATGRAELMDLARSLASAPCPPTLTLDSGGGLQFFWRLAEKLPVAEHMAWAEDQGAGIARMVDGDAVQNVDRLMRLPGTINYPKPDKRERGQPVAPARVIADTGHTYAPETLSAWVAPVKGAKATSVSSEEEGALIADLDFAEIQQADVFADLPSPLRIKFLDACKADEALRALWAGEKGGLGSDSTGSGFRASLAVRLARAGQFSPQEFGQLAWVWPHAVTPGKDREQSITPREVARCWLNVAANKLPPNPFDWFQDLSVVELNPFEQAAAADAEERSAKDDPGRFNFLTFERAADEALTDWTPPLIRGLLDQRAMSVLYGDSNAGKTFVAVDMAYHIWQGVPYGGLPTEQGNVVYIAAEGGLGIKRRLRALAIERSPDKRDGFHVLTCPVNLLDPEADLNALIGAIRLLGPISFLVIDTLSRALAGGDENASTDMGAFVRNLDQLRHATQAHVMVIHHTGKDRAKGARGHSLLRAATDTEIEIERVEEAGKVGGLLCVTKQRDMDGGFKRAFALRSVPLGLAPDGELVTSAVACLESEEASRAVLKPATASEEAVRERLLFVLSTSPDKAATTAEVHKALGRGKEDTTRTHLRNLAKKGHVVQVEAGRWAVGPVENASTVTDAERKKTDCPVEAGRKSGRSENGGNAGVFD